MEHYEATWINRCYFDGVPDEVPSGINATGRAPSWKSVAVCLLKNDLMLTGLGFSTGKERLGDAVYYAWRSCNPKEEVSAKEQLDFDF